MSKKNLRMDRSKYFSTVHGERMPDDEHRNVHYVQDGLMYDASGSLIIELVPDNKRAAVEAKIKKLNGEKSAVPAVPQDDDDNGGEGQSGDDGGDEGGGSSDDDVNLEAWLRGEQQFAWFKVAAAIRDRFKKQVNNAADAVVFLIEENVVPPDQVADKFKKHLT